MFHINSLVPELWCSNFDQSIRFYTDVLGFWWLSDEAATSMPTCRFKARKS